MKHGKTFLKGLAAAFAVGLTILFLPQDAFAKETEPDYSYVAKDIAAWEAVYEPLLSKYTPQSKELPEQDSKDLDAKDAADALYAITADAKKDTYPGAYRLKKALILYDVLQGNYSQNAVGLLLDHGLFTDYYEDLSKAHLLPDGYKLPSSYYETSVSDEMIETEDTLGAVTVHLLMQTDSPYLEAEQLLAVAQYSNDKKAIQEQQERIGDFEDSYTPKARTRN